MSISPISTQFHEIQAGSDRYLVTPQGEVIPEKAFSSHFAKELSDVLMDSSRADFIARCFDEILAPQCIKGPNPASALHEWKEALKYYGSLLGSDPKEMLRVFDTFAHKEVQDFIKRNPETAERFFHAIGKREGILNQGLERRSKKVVILTSSSGGGHITTANAIKEMIEKKGYEGIIVNQDELDKENDPLLRAGVKYKGEEISMADVYNRVFQQDNDLKTANELWSIGNRLKAYVPNEQMKKVVEKIRSIKPAALFSVATHHKEHASLANMTATKLNYLHTDFDFNNALLPIADKVKPELVNFWINAPDPEILQGKKIGDWEVPLLPLKGKSIFVAGYPVRGAFVRETNPGKLDAIRNEKGIEKGEKVVLLSMGRQGIRDHILKYLKMAIDPGSGIDRPTKIVVVCGKNEKLKEEIEEFFKNIPPGQRSKFVDVKAEGFVDEKNMADYFKIADAIITKPGGATSAEAAEMGVPMLSVDPHPWEMPNQDYLERHGLAARLESDETFVSQLKDLMQRKENGIAFQPVSWKSALSGLVAKDLTVKRKHSPLLTKQEVQASSLFRQMQREIAHFAKRWQTLMPSFFGESLMRLSLFA